MIVLFFYMIKNNFNTVICEILSNIHKSKKIIDLQTQIIIYDVLYNHFYDIITDKKSN